MYDYEVERVVRVIDADTFDLTLARHVDFGFYLIEYKRYSCRFRLAGVDAPERSDPRAAEATIFASGWLIARAGRLRATTYKADHFGRWLADLYDGVTREQLADELVRHGLAVPYRKARP